MLLLKFGYKMRRINLVVTKATLTYYCILLSLNFISTAEVRERGTEGNRKRIETDPVSSLFSELGDLFLDIDRTLAIRTAPKVEFEDQLVQILKPPNRYFSNVQENYRTLQKSLGALVRDSIAPGGIFRNADLSTVRPPNLQGGNGNIFSPRHSSDMNTDTLKVTGQDRKGSLQHASEGENLSNNECSAEIINNPFIDSRTRERCFKRLKRHVERDDSVKNSKERFMLDSRRKNRFVIPFESNEFGIFPDGFLRRGGDIAESETKPDGRIIGDVLHSESLFDRNIRQLLRDHGKWILDNPFLSRWRQPSTSSTKDDAIVTTEGLTTETDVTTEERSSDSASDMESTPAFIPVTTELNTEIPVSEETYTNNVLPPRSANYYTILDDDDIIEEEVDIVLNPESDIEVAHSVEILDELDEKPYSKETVILAFTPDGLPLKLRTGPEIENPVRFLHKVLNSAGVSLNVPVKSYDDVEPVGREVMKFGAGVLTRAIYFDLSNTDELKTLLKTLMKSKASGKSKF